MTFYDNHNIDEQFQLMKKLMIDIEKDTYKFIGKIKNKAASVRARNKLRDLRKLTTAIRESIRKQRNNNKNFDL